MLKPIWEDAMRTFVQRTEKSVIDIVEKDGIKPVLKKYRDFRVIDYREKHIKGFLEFIERHPTILQKLYDDLDDAYVEYKKHIKVNNPTADPSAGDRGFSAPEEIFFKCEPRKCHDSEIDIYFTTDGKDVDPFNLRDHYVRESTFLYKETNTFNPTTETWTKHSNCVISAPCTVRAVACLKKDKVECSDQVEFNYTQGTQVATPTVEFADKVEIYADTLIKIECTTDYAEIRYTLDGNDVTKENSILYKEEFPFKKNATLKVKAFRDGKKDSEQLERTWATKIKNVVFTPAAGEVEKDTEVALTCPNRNAVIRFTTDGSDITTNSPRYSNPIKITEAMTIKAQAFRSGSNDSYQTSADYTLPTPTTTA